VTQITDDRSLFVLPVHPVDQPRKKQNKQEGKEEIRKKKKSSKLGFVQRLFV
jgi:hypothetical protein